MSGMLWTPVAEEHRQRMDRAVARHVPAVLAALAVIALVAALFVDAGATTAAGQIVLVADWLLTAVFAVCAVWTWRRGVPDGWGHPIFFGLGVTWTIYAVYSLGAFGAVLDVAILIFVALASGLFLLLPRWQVTLLAIAGGSFLVPVLAGAVQDPATAGVFLLAALFLGGISGRYRTRLHLELAEANERIRRRGEERVRRLTDRLDEVVWIMDVDRSEIRYVNPAFETVYGRPPEEILEDPSAFLEHVHADDREALRDAFDRSAPTPFEVEFHYERPDGETRCIVARGQPIRGRDGEVIEWAGISQDVTERRRYVRALERANEELARSRREIESYVQIASHELKRPIRDVTRFASLLEGEGNLGVDPDEASRYVRLAAGRLHRRLEAFLDYLEDELRPLEPQRVDADQPLSQALARLRETLGVADPEVARRKLPTVWVDPDLLTEVFYQLLDNACRYNDDPPARIDVAAERDDDEWVFTIRDDGIGIPQDRSDRIFQPFQRLTTEGSPERTGIGLAVVRRAVERHGGRVEAEADPEGGSVFRFSLPVGPGQMPPVEAEPGRVAGESRPVSPDRVHR